MTHEPYSPVQEPDGRWYVECSCGEDEITETYEDGEEWLDIHTRIMEEDVAVHHATDPGIFLNNSVSYSASSNHVYITMNTATTYTATT